MSLSVLKDKSLVLLFAFAPTGLGHLRVTDALYHGLPEGVSPLLLGSQDKSISRLYRFISIHPLTRHFMESLQRGPFEKIFTYFYRLVLRKRATLIYEQILTILDERIDVPKTLLLVATHFELAHKIGAIKEKIAKNRKITVIIVVQVTDDSPQPIWYVPSADLTFVPSERTKTKLEEYGKNAMLDPIPFLVSPYPLSPTLAKQLSTNDHEERVRQVTKDSRATIHVSLPIPGAAVGTEFFIKLIDILHGVSNRFIFHIIATQAVYTKSFLLQMAVRNYVDLTVSPNDQTTVDNYEHLYQRIPIAIEITKPSEQAFKALCKPTQYGGALLLFAEPVGKQEYDNLFFLRRHHLIPQEAVQNKLWHLAERQIALAADDKLLDEAKGWRGLMLPKDPVKSAEFICWCMDMGIFSNMMHYIPHQDFEEVTTQGTELFWRTIAEYLVEKQKSFESISQGNL